MTKPATNVQPGAADAETLRFVTCGSVGAGKSTLIDRLLQDSRLLTEDRLAELENKFKKSSAAGGALDDVILVDGLEAGRDQAVATDVAYRFFATPARCFIVTDSPGHEQYTRNMAAGASKADMAMLLVDAATGIATQTRGHAVIASLLGIRQAVLAVNKMDLIGFDEVRFNAVVEEFQVYAAELGFQHVKAIPVSARSGDNVSDRSDRTPWYDGPSLFNHLETVQVTDSAPEAPFRLPVLSVSQSGGTDRGLAGTIAGGTVSVGQKVVVVATGRGSQVTSLQIGSDPVHEAAAGRSVMLTLADEIGVDRGDMLVAPDARPELTDQFAAHLIWIASDPLLPGRKYHLKTAARTVSAQVT
ncbi:MAG TPA: GTP-binding protein, partial [Afifellaceae bacterium]|nr:GTP-binding protein [Afifellaceae bacterium]